ncbi:cation/acetate symporter ActP [Bradyrhizobium pachyrhizi]|uniref:Cation/acetate symporter ActP n=1 Tax=Bradyrhizobium pachyrhizi TaxID=280333 RepID=A0A844SZ84_9BRAD|nr:cation/acetate symporter ActP [Bradyrhizobium pachyrhizi]MVT69429.1 cation/acetate symporter ActP [Bradyrhizobium pachyrhizi]
MGSSTLSIGFFFAFMALTLAITYWAARRTRTTEHFFAAGGQVTPWQNGWALAGDFLSAAALLGIAGIVTSNGFDGMIYSIGWLVGWPIILFLIVEPLRNVGRFTFADVVAYRLRQRPVRLAGAIGTLAVILFYLIAQMVATGSLIKLLFGLPYTWSVIVVGSVMLVYVLFGGMLATTWVQVVKAVLLMGGGILLALLVLTHFDMNPLKLFAAASEKYGTRVLQPGSKVVSGQWDAISLGLGLMFGTAAMPHVLMRAYTVKDSKAARLSILYATGLIGVFHLMVFIIGFGAMVLVGAEAVAKAGGGGNMAAPLLALTVGGNAFFGFICAVAFATMLAVVAGLTLSGVATLCHDVWTNVIRNGTASEAEQLKVARVATVLISILAIGLGIAFEGQNVAFMAGLAFSIACAANFPSLVLAITWRHFTTPAAVASILVGTLSSLVLIYLSPTIQVDILGKPLAAIEHQWWFVSLRNPAIISMPLSFAVAILLSLVTREKNANLAFDEMQRRILVGPVQPTLDDPGQAKNAA